ncbi:MAG: 5'/3'-nucleotidase SurE [Myxococcales bacterium]|nr:5'/3'-nucleotidase SurE [Myxococcota bacterium]MDW8282886.1 5'/3'-nucleotidase SurE [Myxococcales bacterium]
MKILLTNDDGVRADGLSYLASRLADLGDVWVVAPDRERSAASHALTLHEPLRVERVAPQWFAVSGTPADCVYLALLELCRDAALVLSGINHGYNLGSDIFYSGTVAGAVEAALRGVPAIAVSTAVRRSGTDFRPAADLCHALARAVLTEGLPKKTLLNVNVPQPPEGRPPQRGYCWTRLGERVYRDLVDSRTDPRGGTYYWIGGGVLPVEAAPGTDLYAVGRGIASVTPLGLDLTHDGLLERLPEWRLHGFEAVMAHEQQPVQE